ncbi:MAG: ornithine--oxo-acid transaminase [Gammaproteobacteria bacterium]|nr:ornithine--oxo-acid transaminase [Gammaproteobacteria bacterium]
MNTTIQLERQYGAHNYEPLPVVLTRGEGIFVWDDQGKRYIDMMSAYSAVSFGHCHPVLLHALTEQAKQLSLVSRAFYTNRLGHFLQKACQAAHQERALPMNSGAEAVETALKVARKWAYAVKKVPHDAAEIIACEGNFHGRTIAIVAMSSEPQYKHQFGPFPAGNRLVPYGDVEALRKAITPNTAAFLVEPIQGEAGIVVPPKGYLKACAEICRENNVLLIVDEIQTGLGRTGRFLACEYEDIKPDAVLLGKALGGGFLPVSLFLTRNDVMDVLKPGDHGSTFGGNPLAAAVGSAALDLLFSERMIEHAAELGEYFKQALLQIKSPIVTEVRGRGLLVGLAINPRYYSAREICIHLLDKGILTKDTHETIVRLAPPLIITREQIDTVVAAIQAVLVSAETNASL